MRILNQLEKKSKNVYRVHYGIISNVLLIFGLRKLANSEFLLNEGVYDYERRRK